MTKDELKQYVQDNKPEGLNYSQEAMDAILELQYAYAVLGQADMQAIADKSLNILLVMDGITRDEFMDARRKLK